MIGLYVVNLPELDGRWIEMLLGKTHRMNKIKASENEPGGFEGMNTHGAPIGVKCQQLGKSTYGLWGLLQGHRHQGMLRIEYIILVYDNFQQNNSTTSYIMMDAFIWFFLICNLAFIINLLCVKSSIFQH